MTGAYENDILILPPSMAEEIKSAPDDQVSANDYLNEVSGAQQRLSSSTFIESRDVGVSLSDNSMCCFITNLSDIVSASAHMTS